MGETHSTLRCWYLALRLGSAPTGHCPEVDHETRVELRVSAPSRAIVTTIAKARRRDQEPAACFSIPRVDCGFAERRLFVSGRHRAVYELIVAGPPFDLPLERQT